MEKSHVFICYSHKDQEYLDRLLIHLKPLQRDGRIALWVDSDLRAGDRWRAEITHALDRASVAILLVSADFLASDFITENELPPILRKAEARGMRVIPVIVKPCGFERDTNLQQFQSFNKPSETVVRMTEGKREKLYADIAAEVERVFGEVKKSLGRTVNADVEKIASFKWFVRLRLERFNPNSQITIASRGRRTNSQGSTSDYNWSRPYDSTTNDDGTLELAFEHVDYGEYTYTFTDESGGSASVTVTYGP